MNHEFSKIFIEVIKEYEPAIEKIENEREKSLNDTIIRIAAEVSIKALEKYHAKFHNSDD